MKKLVRFPFYFFHSGYAGLAVVLQSLLLRLDPKPERRRALEFFRNGQRLRAMKWEGEQEYPVYVINRQCDGERLARFARSCSKWGVQFERVDAVNCADPNFDFRPHDSQIADTFYGKQDFLRGAVGCFLSHAKAWQKLLDSGFSHALICEDDARWLGPIPKRIAQFGVPSDSDIGFVHQRLGAGLEAASNPKPSSFFKFETVSNAAHAILMNSRQLPASGGEGYLLSRSGAEKVLAIMEKQGIFMEVDWFLFFHSLSEIERLQFIEKDGTGRFDALEFASLKLHAAVISPSLVDQWDNESTIAYDNPKNYISRCSMRRGSADMFPIARV